MSSAANLPSLRLTPSLDLLLLGEDVKQPIYTFFFDLFPEKATNLLSTVTLELDPFGE